MSRLKAADELILGLRDPGLTPILRAGLGGLAASIRAIGVAAESRVRVAVAREARPGRGAR